MIIGLLVGGVLVGQELIRTAEIHKQISQIEGWRNATNVFKLKYNCLPGDCSNITAFISDPNVQNGNGNGMISYANYLPALNFSGEIQQFWLQLYDSGLLAGISPQGVSGTGAIGIDLPRNVTSASGTILFFSGEPNLPAEAGYYSGPNYDQIKYDHYFWLNIGWNISSGGYSNVASASGRRWASRIVYAIDNKIDDGNGLTGKLFAPSVFANSGAMGGTNGPGWSYNGACRNSLTGVYVNLNNDAPVSGQGDGAGCYIVLRF